MDDQLPPFMKVIQAIGPTFVAVVVGLIAAYVAYRQWETAKNRLKLDLFEKRYELLNVINSIIRLANKDTENFLFEMSEEQKKIRQYALLFPKEISDKVDALVETCYEFQGLLQDRKDMRGTPEIAQANKNFRESQAKLERRFVAFQTEIADFIRVEWRA